MYYSNLKCIELEHLQSLNNQQKVHLIAFRAFSSLFRARFLNFMSFGSLFKIIFAIMVGQEREG